MAGTTASLTRRAKLLLVLIRLQPIKFKLDTEGLGYQLAIPDSLQSELTQSVYEEIIESFFCLNLVRVHTIQLSSGSPYSDPFFATEIFCSAKGFRWANSLPNVPDYWRDYNSKTNDDFVKFLRRFVN